MENKEISFSHSDAMQALTIVSPKSDLLSIRLYRCLVEPCEIDSDDSDGRLGTNYKHFGDNEFGCLVEYTSIVLYSKQDSDPQDTTRRGVKFTAAFDARYDIAHDDFDEEEIKAFARTSAIFQTWPYWREYMPSMCARAGLSYPAITKPLPIHVAAHLAGYKLEELETEPNENTN